MEVYVKDIRIFFAIF